MRELLARFSSEELLKPQSYYPTDSRGDPYIPLSGEITEPIPFNPNRPGKSIMIHFMSSNVMDPEGEAAINRLVAQIKQQGFLSSRRFATFSTSSLEYEEGHRPIILSNRTFVLVYRGYSRRSREFAHDGYTPWAESLVGVTEDQAEAISPQAVAYHKERHRGGDVWAYVPPKHLLGIIDFHSRKDALAFDVQNRLLRRSYTNGLISEAEAAKRLTELSWGLTVAGLNGNLTDPERQLFWSSFSGVLTESALLELITRDGLRVSELKAVRPSYLWTRSLQKAALSRFPWYASINLLNLLK